MKSRKSTRQNIHESACLLYTTAATTITEAAWETGQEDLREGDDGDEMEEVLGVYDEGNKLIGEAPRSFVHEKGFYHRGAIVFLMNQRGEIYLQRRSEGKDTSPGCWDYSVGEHLKRGESYERAAVRGLREELGIGRAKLRQLRGPHLNYFLYDGGRIDREFDVLFLAESDDEPQPNEEVEEGRFLSEGEIQNMLDRNAVFSEFFMAEWPEFKRLRAV